MVPRALHKGVPCRINVPCSNTLPDRRQQPDVSRLPRDPRADRAGRTIDQRRLRFHHDAAQAARGSPARVHCRVVRPAVADVSLQACRRLQSQPHRHARRPGRAGAMGLRSMRSDGRADLHLGRLRGRRRDRDAGEPSRRARLAGGDRDRRQRLLSARRRRYSRLQSARRRPLVRRRGCGAEVRRQPGAGGGRAGADGRHQRQHQGRARHRREGRDRPDRGIRIARSAAGEGR